MHVLGFILVLLQIKHWYVDFVNQSPEEVRCKGIYGDITGIGHSFKQGILSTCILWPFFGIDYAIFGGIFDFVTHYHTDWVKVRFGNQDISNPRFWNHLGLDQMVHQIVYILITLFFPFV